MTTSHASTVRVAGRALRGDVRAGDPARPLLRRCTRIGGGLEILQPFVDALDPGRPVIRFDLPGIGGSPLPAVPYHLGTLPWLLAGLPGRLGSPPSGGLSVSR